MVYRVLADAVVLVHLGFIVFVAAGALLAWRWPALVWGHLPAVAWAAATVLIGLPCPLTALEKGLRRWSGTGSYDSGFVDRYVEGVVYPEEYTLVLRSVAVVAIAAGYLGLRHRARPGRDAGAYSSSASLGSSFENTNTPRASIPAETPTR